MLHSEGLLAMQKVEDSSPFQEPTHTRGPDSFLVLELTTAPQIPLVTGIPHGRPLAPPTPVLGTRRGTRDEKRPMPWALDTDYESAALTN
jgi:hypothetical protein